MAHKVSQSEVNTMLKQTGFGANVATLPAADPIVITQMVLKLNQIRPYDRNPRQTKNPKYDSIKESIRQQGGLNNNFNVTRRPGDEYYMIQSGGNTRYAILKELYEETRDERFNTVQCLFVPWQNEASILSNHLVENLMRGDMLFIEQAYAIAALKNQLEEQSGKPMSAREFENHTKKLGLDVSRRTASRMNFAIELDQYIPLALKSGLSLTNIDYLSTLKSDCKKITDLSSSQIDALFASTLTELDHDHIEIEQVRPALCQRIAQVNNTTPEIIDAMMLDNWEASTEDQGHNQKEALKQTEKTTKTHSDKDSSGYDYAKKIAEKYDLGHVVKQVDTALGYTIEVGQPAPLQKSTWLSFLSALENHVGVGIFGDIDLLNVDQDTLEACISLIKHCQQNR